MPDVTASIRATGDCARVRIATGATTFVHEQNFADRKAAKLSADRLLIRLAASDKATMTVDGLVFQPEKPVEFFLAAVALALAIGN